MKLYKPIDGLIDGGSASRRRKGLMIGTGVLLAVGFLVYVAVDSDESDTGSAPAPETPRAQEALAGLGTEPAPQPTAHPAAPAPFGAPEGSAAVEVAPKPTEENPEPAAAPSAPQTPEVKVAAVKAKPAPVEVKDQVLPGKAGEFEGRIGNGQSLYQALAAKRFTAKQITPAIHALGKKVDFRKTRPGDRWRVRYDATGRVLELHYQRSPEHVHTASYSPSKGYEVRKRTVPVETRVRVVGGTVRGSVYKALRDLGESPAIIRQFINVFQYDFEFAGDSKPGDTFRLAYEQVFVDGKFVRSGRIVAAEYAGKKKTLRAYWSEPSSTYLDGNGQSLRRMFLKNPVPESRITSKFGKRFHPVLKRWAQHNGVDYAAKRGTEIRAIADGTITFIGKKGPNGNLIAIKHPNGMTSYYAHQSRFAAGMEKGKKVRQGRVIGYVGSTGRSTGPHLHLALRSGSRYLDPLKIKSTRGLKLSGRKLVQFRTTAKKLDRKLDAATIAPPSTSPPEPEPVGGDDLGAIAE